jgi:hypothetical protein
MLGGFIGDYLLKSQVPQTMAVEIQTRTSLYQNYQTRSGCPIKNYSCPGESCQYPGVRGKITKIAITPKIFAAK